MQSWKINCPLLAPSHCAHKLTKGLSPRPPAQALSTSVAFKARKPLLQHSCRRVRAASQPDASATSTSSVSSLSDAPLQPVSGEPGALPNTAGVYAVYDKEQKLQYIGLSRKVAVSVANHIQDMPDHTHSVKFATVPDPTKDNLTAAWKQWIQSAVEANGAIPPGNAPGAQQQWVRKAPRAKPELKLTPGKGIQDLTCSVEDLLDSVVKSNKVVAFIKGTRTQPQCGFSYKVLTMLNEARTDYEVVNVLDEQYNPGVREAIKSYSQWPTIPQLYIKGEFVGGADIIEEMNEKGELKQMVQ
ncbi:MAG: monothiol glutaredoxin- chloroplastic-like [Trebouxia sp. A1-2]|nr:MAG: monothiol glutaredoxin- chloroplastic-like [Trebouxia sp. A1-2]